MKPKSPVVWRSQDLLVGTKKPRKKETSRVKREKRKPAGVTLTRSTIYARLKKGIPINIPNMKPRITDHPKFNILKQFIGAVPDAIVAEAFDTHFGTIRRYRIENKIPNSRKASSILSDILDLRSL